MTSFIAAGGSGRSTSFIPAVPAAWSVTTIAFMGIVSSVLFVGNGAGNGKPIRHLCQRPWVVSQVALGGVDRTQPADLADVHRWARVAHGRTRMIVFPLIRSVG